MLAIYKVYNNENREEVTKSGVVYSYNELWEATFSPFSDYVIFDRLPRLKTYEAKKEYIRSLAIESSAMLSDIPISWGELAMIQDYFRTYGKRFGLLKEFHENAIA